MIGLTKPIIDLASGLYKWAPELRPPTRIIVLVCANSHPQEQEATAKRQRRDPASSSTVNGAACVVDVGETYVGIPTGVADDVKAEGAADVAGAFVWQAGVLLAATQAGPPTCDSARL